MNYTSRYADFLRRFLEVSEPIKVVFDCSNGTTGPVLRELFGSSADINVILINEKADPDFSAHGPNPMVYGALGDARTKILEEQADFGAVFDGDGDRAIFLDNQGERIDPFEVFNLLYQLFDPPYVLDPQAMVKLSMPSLQVIESKTGTYFLREEMRQYNASFGVERTGHYYFKDFYFSDSAILCSIFMINRVSGVKKKGKDLLSLLSGLPKLYRSEEENFDTEKPEEIINRVKKYFSKQSKLEIYFLDGISVMGKDFGFNLRASNTEPLIRLNIAARTKGLLEEKRKEVLRLINK